MAVRFDEVAGILTTLRLEDQMFLLGHGRRHSLVTEQELRAVLGALQNALKVFDHHEFPLSSAETRTKGLLATAYLHVADFINQQQFEAQCRIESNEAAQSEENR
jgi:hypothetical protein